MSNTATAKLPLPKGKLNIRFRSDRCMWQAFAGRNYITGASGENDNEAAQQLANQYDVPAGATAIVHGYRQPVTITIPEAEA